MLCLFLLFVQQQTDRHNHGKYDEVPYNSHLVAQHTGKDHKQTTDNGQRRHNETTQHGLILFLAHPLDHHRHIHAVDEDDRQLGGVEHESALPGAGEVGKIEIQEPCAGKDQRDDRGVVGGVGLSIHLGNHSGSGTVATDSQGIEAAGASHHKTVGSAQAGDGDEQIQNITQHTAENVGESGGSAVVYQLLQRCAAADTDKVQKVSSDDNETADDQRLGQILLGIFDLGVDGGGDDPAFVGKRGSTDTGEQGIARAFCHHSGGVQIVCQRAVCQTVDNAHNSHESQGDHLDDGGSGLEFAGQLGSDGVHGIHGASVEECQSHTLGTNHAAALGSGDQQGEVGVHGNHKFQGVAGGQPGQHGGHGGEVHHGDIPANQIAVALAHSGFCVVDHTIDSLVFLTHKGESQKTHQHDSAADEPGDDAQLHVAAGFLQNILSLKEYARTDHDTDDHADGGKQTVFSFQFVFHGKPSFQTAVLQQNPIRMDGVSFSGGDYWTRTSDLMRVKHAL